MIIICSFSLPVTATFPSHRVTDVVMMGSMGIRQIPHLSGQRPIGLLQLGGERKLEG